ncbi:MAG TPA: calcium-binding protein [Actinophytocola sp.]|uniref:calcium-binding protein n=1 Tax=Actinophytocola sp. TaxID=1872138 RepID=UPI002DDD9420|nr:calcium-binding protein [Actinophytocola sp.]HEV2781606.1 calcium-binding protein [Actinophytocola sp.]
MTDVMAAENWRPLNPAKWQFPGDQVILAERGTNPGPPRRPFEYATLISGPEFASVQIDAEVRIDEPVTRNDRDVIIVFGWRSDTEFYYAHLSQDNTIYPHNGIFVVNNADRLRIDDQWNGSTGAEPSIRDTEFHRIRVRHCAETGRIEVFVDDLERPRITATDKTFGSGRIGFGSFDNYGRLRNLTVTGTDERHVCGGRTPTILGTDESDALVGTPGPDVINGLGGRDAIAGQGGDDIVCGGADSDAIAGGPGADTLYGGPGRDAISGGAGDDTVYGGPDRDLLSGGSGADTVAQDGPER